MAVNIKTLVNQWCANRGVAKKKLVNFLQLTEAGFYAKLNKNRVYLHEVEQLAAFFGVSLIEFLEGKPGLNTYVSEPPGLYAVNQSEKIEALKKEIGYLKQIIDLQNKAKK